MVVAAFHEIFWVLFFFICLEDELKWLGRALNPDFVMSDEELLLGQVSPTAIGLKYCLGYDFSSDRIFSNGPVVYLAHYFGLGPIRAPQNFGFYLLPRRKTGF